MQASEGQRRLCAHANIRGSSKHRRTWLVRCSTVTAWTDDIDQTGAFVGQQRYVIRALNESTWGPFATLVEANGGTLGGCWCMGFHSNAGSGTAAGNRANKLACVRAGTTICGCRLVMQQLRPVRH